MSVALVGSLFALGFALSAAPGALNIETLRRGLHGGFWPAFQIQVGALAGDAIWVVTASAAAVWGLHSPHAQSLCMFAGGGLLLWTAWRVTRPVPLDTAANSVQEATRYRRGLALGAVLALSSPLTVAFWAAVTGLMRDETGRNPAAHELALVGGAYAASVLAWGVLLSAVAVWGRRWLRPGPFRIANLGCAVLLAVWGVQLMGEATGLVAV